MYGGGRSLHSLLHCCAAALVQANATMAEITLMSHQQPLALAGGRVGCCIPAAQRSRSRACSLAKHRPRAHSHARAHDEAHCPCRCAAACSRAACLAGAGGRAAVAACGGPPHQGACSHWLAADCAYGGRPSYNQSGTVVDCKCHLLMCCKACIIRVSTAILEVSYTYCRLAHRVFHGIPAVNQDSMMRQP